MNKKSKKFHHWLIKYLQFAIYLNPIKLSKISMISLSNFHKVVTLIEKLLGASHVLLTSIN